MSMKLKALGLGLLAMVATSAFAAMNASATTDGHFVVGSHSAFITGEHAKNTSHELHFRSEEGAERLGCDVAQYTGTHTNDSKTPTTTTSLTITPKWEQCYTTNSSTKFDIHENGCDFLFTARAAGSDATVHVKCPNKQKITITHPSCDISIPEQTVGGVAGNGVTYTNIQEPTYDYVTMHVKVSKITAEYHNGICVFLGTHHEKAIMEGSVTVTGFSNADHSIRTNITAT